MPKFTNTPSLGLVYETLQATYPYGGLDLSDFFTDERQLGVLWNLQTILVNGISTNINELTTDTQVYLRTLPSSSYTVDSGPNKEITPGWAGLVRVRNGITYTYPPAVTVTADEPLAIIRSMDIDELDVVFQSGSRLTSDQLNTAIQQAFLSIQELFAFYQDEGTSPIAPPGEQGETGPQGIQGETGDGFTGGSYDANTGTITFTSDDGLGFSSSDLRGTPTSVTLDAGAVHWNADSAVISASAVLNLFDSTPFPTAASSGVASWGGSYTASDFAFVAGASSDSTSAGFIAPVTGTYLFSTETAFDAVATGVAQHYGRYMVNGISYTPSMYNYGTDPGTQGLHPMTDVATIELTAGDYVSYLVGAGGSSVDLSFRYMSFNVTCLTLDASILSVPGADGLGWTGGSYDGGTGVITFTSDDGLGFVTDDLRASGALDNLDDVTITAPVLNEGIVYDGGGFVNTRVLTGDDLDAFLGSGMSTGVGGGGILTINGGDNTKFDISDGHGYIVDAVNNPHTITEVTWAGLTAQTVTNIGTQLTSYISITDAGAVQQDSTKWDCNQYRTHLPLGVVVHPNGTTIQGTNNEQHVSSNPGSNWHDLAQALGFLNISGNTFSANATNLKLNKSSGTIFGSGLNYVNDPECPHLLVLPAKTATPIRYQLADSTSLGFSDVLPNTYDDGTSTPATVPTNKFTVQRIYNFPSNDVVIQPGQTLYGSLAAAVEGSDHDAFITSTQTGENAVLRALLAIQEGTTDLTDVTKARFIPVGKFGASSGGGAINVANISDLSDVDTITTLPNPTDYLTWDDGTSEWKPTALSVDLPDLGADLGSIVTVSNGMALDSPGVTVAVNTGVITLSLEANGGASDLRLVFSDGVYTFDTTPAATIALGAGTDTVPVMNYVFIPQSTKVLTVNTSGFPATEHAPIATVLCQSVGSVDTDGPLKVHAWTDHASSSNNMGHFAHINEWIRHQPATWLDGVTLTPAVGAAAFDISTSAGNILQLHSHSFPAFNTATGSDIYVVNDPTTAYLKADNLTQTFVSQDINGDALGDANTDFYNLVIWGSANEAEGDCKLFVNVPDGGYANNNAAEAENDVNKTAIYTIPSDFTGTGFLIARLCVNENAGTYSIIKQESLLGQFPSSAAGAGSAGLDLAILKAEVAASTDFANFQARIAAL